MDNELINKAFLFAQEKHKGQTYNNGEFIQHPLQTYEILKTILPEDTNLLAAGLLHDTIEDCGISKKTLESLFNEDVASLVWEVTKESYNFFPNLRTRRGVLLKFADRLSNLASMTGQPVEWQAKYILKSKFWKS